MIGGKLAGEVMRLKAIMVLVLIFFGVFGCLTEVFAKSYEAYVRLIDYIAVPSPKVLLGDIANIESENKELRERLIRLVVGGAPKISSSRIISSFRIKNLLEKEGFASIKVYGVQSTVTIEEREFSREEIKEVVLSWVEDQVDDDREVVIDFLRLPGSWIIPKGGGDSIRVESSKKKGLCGKMTLTLRSMFADRIMSSTRVRAEIFVFRKVPCIVRPIQRGEKISIDHVKVLRSDVSGANGMEIVRIEDVLGLVAKKNLPVGSFLYRKDFECPVLIERGSLNRVVVVNGAVRMSIAGAMSLQNGREGELILFSNPLNRKETIKARVMRSGLAMLILN